MELCEVLLGDVVVRVDVESLVVVVASVLGVRLTCWCAPVPRAPVVDLIGPKTALADSKLLSHIFALLRLPPSITRLALL